MFKNIFGFCSVNRLEKDDVFVRVKIVSTALMPNPYTDGETKKAWSQPILTKKFLN